MTPAFVEPVRSLADLAVDIVDAHNAFIAAAHTALDRAKHAGDLLIEAKGQVQHGEWLFWLKEHCPGISPRVAQGYMRIAREWPRLLAANANRVSFLPIRDALTILVDEWTDPDELASGGSNEQDTNGGCGTGTRTARDSNIRMVRLFFTVETLAEFKRQIRDLKTALHTKKTTDTVREVVRLAHAAIFPRSTDDDPPAHEQRFDVELGRLEGPVS